MPRKDYELYKRLYDKGDSKYLKCKIIDWNNGYDIFFCYVCIKNNGTILLKKIFCYNLYSRSA